MANINKPFDSEKINWNNLSYDEFQDILKDLKNNN